MASGRTNLIVRTRSFRAYLSAAGHRNLDDCFRQLTWLWNRALCKRRQAWERDGTPISLYDQYRELTVTRADPEWSRFAVGVQRSALKHLDDAFGAFFRRVKAGEKPGCPRYRTERRPVRSFELTCNLPQVKHTGGRYSWIRVKGIGRIRFRGQPDGRVRAVRLVRTARRVKLQFVCELAGGFEADTRPPIGIDVGISNRVALSDGTRLPGVRLDRRELKRRQRRLSTARKGSNNRRKRRRELAREWQRVTDRERGLAHELTARIVREHGAIIAIEELNIPGMVRNRRLSRWIMEQQWGRLARQLAYKAESAGGRLVRVSAQNTSQTCSGCGRRPEARLTLAMRTFRCADCGLVLDRDMNAAINVCERAFGPLPGGDAPAGAAQEDQRLTFAASA
ncbi:MAG: transposase [Gammaproteobacteria bacterium]|nr:transposase [Gammaproteobacteria bacterium]